MNRRPHEPLSPEERALAEQLARLGPHGEPSPALDARILAAAHEAVAAPAVRHRPRWPVAMGLAATALLAVGIAWQLRPVDRVPVASESASEPVIARIVLPAPAESAAPAPPPPREELPEAVLMEPESPPVLSRGLPEQAPADEAKAPPEPAPAPTSASAHRQATLPAPIAPPPAATATRGQSQPANDGYWTPAPPPAPQAPAVSATDASADSPVLDAVVIDSDASAKRARSAAYRESPQSGREPAEPAGDTFGNAKRRMAPPPAPAAPAAVAGNAAAPAAAGTGLAGHTPQHIEPRLPPVLDDTRLAPQNWLERIRLRRDLGDRGGAIDSLLRFQKAHPFHRVPDDLKELRGE